MKIALIAHLKYPIVQPFAGGLEMHTHLLARLLRERGHDVTLFAAWGSDAALDYRPVCAPTGDAAGDPVRAAAIDAAEFAAYTAILDAVARGGFDIVHNNSLHDLPLRESGMLAMPMLSVLHTPPFASLANGVKDAASDMTFVAVSPSLAREWRGIGVDPEVVGNGIDLAVFPFSAGPCDPSGAFWSGRIVPEKGLHLAIDAARIAGLNLAFAGPRSDMAYWHTEIAPRLGGGVADLGHLDHAALAARLGRAQVALVTPCWEEPFGLVVAEALACGTPVAAFARGALPGILDATCGRLAPAGDTEGLARAMRAAAGLDRRACRARAEALFDAREMTDRYEALYAGHLVRRTAGAVEPRDRLRDEMPA